MAGAPKLTKVATRWRGLDEFGTVPWPALRRRAALFAYFWFGVDDGRARQRAARRAGNQSAAPGGGLGSARLVSNRHHAKTSLRKFQ